ncbi:hypothetical protein, partial [Rhodoplanes sp. SY1]|uniref:hypothetical protein n=1 Tax=Rhodoplanes sp. SY1 TaxID=3166646 RepID=UPI0038B608D9
MCRRRAFSCVPLRPTLALGIALLAGCNVPPPLIYDTREPDVFDKVRSIDLLPRYPEQRAEQ